ncbi:MAG: hypothetical protein R6W96_08955 [Clostridia bacterium]
MDLTIPWRYNGATMKNIVSNHCAKISLETALVLPGILLLVTAVLFIFISIAGRPLEDAPGGYMEAIRQADSIIRKVRGIVHAME